MFVLAGEEGGQYPEGEDDAGGGLALGVVLVSGQPGGLSLGALSRASTMQKATRTVQFIVAFIVLHRLNR